MARTSSKQIGHRLSPSSDFQSLYFPFANFSMTSRGVDFDLTSPKLEAKLIKFS